MSVKEKVMDAGQAVAEKAKAVGHKIADGAEQAAGWVKEKTGVGAVEGKDLGVSAIRERMDVIASCGHKIGVVDHVEGSTLKLTKSDSNDGQHHYIPVGWVQLVDGQVHLSKNSVEAVREWKSDAASCGCGS